MKMLRQTMHSPVGCWDALRTGFRQRNLYSFELNELLDMDYESLLNYVENCALPARVDGLPRHSRLKS